MCKTISLQKNFKILNEVRSKYLAFSFAKYNGKGYNLEFDSSRKEKALKGCGSNAFSAFGFVQKLSNVFEFSTMIDKNG
jgi:hypothetical protein